MNFYLELTLLSNAELGNYFLWSKLYKQLHLALVNMQDDKGVVPIGISFPEYDFKKSLLGTKLRLLANSETELTDINISKWLCSMVPYIHISGIHPVPQTVLGYGNYQRQQAKSNKARLARRQARRKGISLDEAHKLFEGYTEETLDTPYINMQSLSSSNNFRLFIQKNKATELINEGFSSYGLSDNSTVPEF